MAIKAPSNIKDPVATTRGWTNKKGELLKSQKLTQEQCDEFNGVERTVVVSDLIIEVEEKKVEEKPKAKRKPRAKKKADPKKDGYDAKPGVIASAIKKLKGE